MTILAMLRNWEWNTTKPEVRRRFRHLEETVTFRGHFLVAGALDRAKHFRMNENGPGSALDPTPGRTVRIGFGSPVQNSRAAGNPHSHRNAAPIRPKLLAKAEGLAMIE
jgi:hypothetical protein